MSAFPCTLCGRARDAHVSIMHDKSQLLPRVATHTLLSRLPAPPLCPPRSPHSRTCIRPKLAHHRTSSLSRDWSRRWYMNYADRVFLCGSLNWIRVKRKKQAHIPLSRLAGRKPRASMCHTPAYTGKSCLW